MICHHFTELGWETGATDHFQDPNAHSLDHLRPVTFRHSPCSLERGTWVGNSVGACVSPLGIFQILFGLVSVFICAPLGAFLLVRALFLRVSGLHAKAGWIALGFCLILFVALPLAANITAEVNAYRLLAGDFSDRGHKSTGLSLTLASDGHSLACGPLCQAHLARHPEGVVTVLDEENPSNALHLSEITASRASYTMAPRLFATCGSDERPRNPLIFLPTPDLRDAEKHGKCLGTAPDPEITDARLITTRENHTVSFAGISIEVTRKILLVHADGTPEPAFQISSAIYKPLRVPLMPFVVDGKNPGFGIAHRRPSAVGQDRVLSTHILEKAVEAKMP